MRAERLAEDWDQAEVHKEHILMALLRDQEFEKLLEAMGISPGRLLMMLREVASEYRQIEDPRFDVTVGEDVMRTLAAARRYCDAGGDSKVSPQHYLLAISDEDGRVGEYIAQYVNQAVANARGRTRPGEPPPNYSNEMRQGLAHARDVAAKWNQREIHNEHFIFALCVAKGDFGAQLARTKLQPDDLIERLLASMRNYPPALRDDEGFRFGADLQQTLADTEILRFKTGSEQVLAIHYLLALLEDKSEIARYIANFVNEAVRESRGEGS